MKIVLAHGCWDQLHVGHIRHLQEARSLGDKLVVSVTADKYVRKGMGRPYFSEHERVEALKALSCVDDAFINDDDGPPVEAIKKIRPAFYVKGVDYGLEDPRVAHEKVAVESYGGTFYITKTQKYSSSRILKEQRFSPDVVRYLDLIRDRGFLDRIRSAFDDAAKLKIVFVGESIIDEYRYVRGLGRPSKEFMLSSAVEGVEAFRGGIDAAAAHCDWDARIVTGGSPITKVRFVDHDFNRKLFEVYSSAQLEINTLQRADFRHSLSNAVMVSDLVILMDFGHGLIGPTERKTIEHSHFLAINAQTNAGNAGFNPITLHRRADLVCIDEPEARLAAGEQFRPLATCLGTLRSRMNIESLIITRGKRGAICSYQDGKSISMPAIVSGGIDTMGAGDAFLATAAPLVAVGLDLEAATFVGNIAGAIKTTIVGHRTHVTRAEVLQNVEALLA